MSPADSAAASAMKSAARLRFLERRTSRSPRMSCSATTAKRSVSKPGFQRQHGKPRLPRVELFELGKRADAFQIAEVVLGKDLRQPVERAFGPAGDDHAAAIAPRTAAMCLTAASKTLALGSARSSAKLCPVREPAWNTLRGAGVGRGEGRELDRRAVRQRGDDVVGRQIEQIRRRRLVGHGVLERAAGLLPARLVVVEDQRVALVDRLARQMVENDRRARQIVEHRVQPLVVERQPVLHAGEAPALR